MGFIQHNSFVRFFSIVLCTLLTRAASQNETAASPFTIHQALHEHGHDIASFKPTHTFQCGYIETGNWTRRFCFTDKIDVKRYVANPHQTKGNGGKSKSGGTRLLYMRMHLEVHKKLPGQSDAVYEPVCGDSLRIVFSSQKALFSPLSLTHPSCGQYSIGFILPRDSEAYAAEVRLLHVDGEGRADPSEALWPPVDLNHRDREGPVVYNIDTRIRGLLHAPEHYAYHPVVTEHGNPGIVPEAEVTGMDLGMLDSAGRHRREGLFVQCKKEFNEVREHDWSSECKIFQAQMAHSVGLPACSNGNHPGRWVRSDSLYPNFKDPWVWQPYSCSYYLFTSQDLHSCLHERFKRPELKPMRETKPNRHTDMPLITFMGESTMEAIWNQWDEKLSTDYFYWDDFVDAGECEECDKPKNHFGYKHNATHPKVALHTQHGVEQMLREFHEKILWDQGHSKAMRDSGDAPRAADALVLLQGANDVQKDTMRNWAARVHKMAADLKKAQDDPAVTSFTSDTTLVWVSPPARQYKIRGGPPGQTVCYGPDNCTAVVDMRHESITGNLRSANGILWGRQQKEQALFFDTVDRRRAANMIAVKALKEHFPALKVVDYRSLTEPLPADYSMDGEHYHCPKMYHDERIQGAWQCINTANAVVSNILANVLCHDYSGYIKSQEYPQFLAEAHLGPAEDEAPQDLAGLDFVHDDEGLEGLGDDDFLQQLRESLPGAAASLADGAAHGLKLDVEADSTVAAEMAAADAGDAKDAALADVTAAEHAAEAVLEAANPQEAAQAVAEAEAAAAAAKAAAAAAAAAAEEVVADAKETEANAAASPQEAAAAEHLVEAAEAAAKAAAAAADSAEEAAAAAAADAGDAAE